MARAYNAKHTHATFHQSEEYAYSLIHLATLLGTLRIKILSTRDIRSTEDDITAIANDGMEWNRNPDDEDDLLPNESILNLNTLEHEGIHLLVLIDSRHVLALRYTQGEWYLLDSELFRPNAHDIQDMAQSGAIYNAYRVAKVAPGIQLATQPRLPIELPRSHE